jgi:hypothetical protein
MPFIVLIFTTLQLLNYIEILCNKFYPSQTNNVEINISFTHPSKKYAIHCTDFHKNPQVSRIIMRISLVPHSPEQINVEINLCPRKYSSHCTNFHKTSWHLSVKKFWTEVHKKNLTNHLVADIRSQVDGCLYIRHTFFFILLLKEQVKMWLCLTYTVQ